jgi:DNA-binding FrmR family transcriptional regulator
MGSNPPAGVVMYYWLAKDQTDQSDISLEITDKEGAVIRTFTAKPDKDKKDETEILGDDDRKLDATAGLNRFVWDIRYSSVERFKDLVLWNDSLKGARAIPGQYRATLKVDDSQQTVNLNILVDPRLQVTEAEYQAQYDFLSGLNHKLTETHRAIIRIREAKSQLAAIEKRVKEDEQFADVLESATELKATLSDIEETLYQTKMESRQDPLNFPIRLNDKLAGLMSLAGRGDHAPSDSAIAVRDELVTAIDAELERLNDVFNNDLAAFNLQAAEAGLEAVRVATL